MSATVTVWEPFVYKHNEEVVPGVPLPAPCPFCGQLDSAIDWQNTIYHVECQYCGADGPCGETPLEAALSWNSRGYQPAEGWTGS